ncbi:hypothetical protein [Flavobacterium caeni]|uniref:Uncharacterized protein n=1 Tax=Flavobacterium caeni TaxID=490189 RepID=A0A1G5K0V3_9FLAO|nr:hypothetical protein [Flavobacterium caeni]SCY94206.1 hypothetical protein SAMN02927903_03012 [Flavobacterium caeni]
MTHSNLFLTLLSIILCDIALAQKNRFPDIPAEKMGILVGTVAIKNKRTIASKHYFLFANDSIKTYLDKKVREPTIWKANLTQYKYSLQADDFLWKKDKTWYYSFKIMIPAGVYTFYELEIFQNTGYMQSTIKAPIQDYNIVFEVKPGQINYLGELNLEMKTWNIYLENEYERDKVKLNKEYKLNLE